MKAVLFQLMLIVALTQSVQAAVVLVDEFGGSSLDTAKWTETDWDVAGGLVTNDSTIVVSVGGGTLTMTGFGPVTGFDKGQTIISSESFAFPTGDEVYTLAADLTAATTTNAGVGQQASIGIGFYTDNNNFITLTYFHQFFEGSGFFLESVRREAGILSGIDDLTPQTVPGTLELSLDSSGAVTGRYGSTTMILPPLSPSNFPTFQVIAPTIGRSSSDRPVGDYDRIELTVEVCDGITPEINDGLDNQCPGDDGFGLVDEISGDAGFHNSADPTEYSWPAQDLATLYEVVRASSPDFSTACETFNVIASPVLSGIVPPPGGVSYHLVRALTPNLGSFGKASGPLPGSERFPPCASP